MNRRFYNLILVLILVGYLVAVGVQWKTLVEVASEYSPENPGALVVVATVMGAALLLLALAKIADLIVKAPVAPEAVKASAKQLKEQAEKDGEVAMKEGRLTTALKIYESAGLTNRALEVARELNDKPTLVRLYMKLGFYDRARRICVDLKDYETAAQCSALMGEVPLARELYKEAAAYQETKGAAARVLGGLWDRAGDNQTASRLYEDGGDMESAAECYELSGDPANARRCQDSAAMLKAYERRAGGFQSPEDDDNYRTDMAQGAKLLESIGDLLGAGMAYRKAGQMLEAAMAFEKYQEWERAAKAFDAVGLKDRADFARANAPARPKPVSDSSAANPAVTPDSSPAMEQVLRPPSHVPQPGNAPAPAFVPAAAQVQYVPVHVAPATAPADPEVQLKVAQRVRRGNFREAAEFAIAGNDWMMGAALYEQAGDLVKAADIYRQIGKTVDAMHCLERAGRTQDAAVLGVATGHEERAIEILKRALAERADAGAGLLLAEVYLKQNDADQAQAVVRDKVAGGAVTPANAATYFLLGQLLERYEKPEAAAAVYRDLLLAGAESSELKSRLMELDPAALEQMPEKSREVVLAGIPEVESAGGVAMPSPPSFKLDLASFPAIGGGGSLLSGQAMSLFGAPPLPPSGTGSDSLFSVEVDEDFDTTEHAVPGAKIKQAGMPTDPFSGGLRYDLKREIARGGMGVVYEAEDTALGRSVALKLIQGQQASPEEFQQFLLEARAIARLNHPNVVTIYDIGVMDLKHYITMEMLRGGPLGDHIAQHPEGLPVKEALRLFVEIARGLQAAHDAGIVHRDIKPGNLLLTERRELKIVDFGLAKLAAGAGHSGETIFRTSGTPGYMAPEQIEGEESLPRVDIYALGITLFFMLIGKPPHVFMGKIKPRQIAAFQMAGVLPSLQENRSEVPAAIEEIYRYCTALEPDERYQSIHQFLPVAEQGSASVQ